MMRVYIGGDADSIVAMFLLHYSHKYIIIEAIIYDV